MSERAPEGMTPDLLREVSAALHAEGDPLADLVRAWASELEGSTQPTRDDLADAIEPDVQAAVFTAKGVREAALDAIDALVARGWVGVSDTPNEAQ